MNHFAPTFTFKRFAVDDHRCAMKVGTDGVLLGAWADVRVGYPASVADVGAGSGLIALMIAQRNRDAHISAVELDAGAFADLLLNISQSDFSSQITPVEGDFIMLKESFDVIVSNPPFFAPGVSAPDASRCLAREAGSLSPLSLIDFASTHLNPEGHLNMIAPSDFDSEIEFQAALHHLYVCRRTAVSTSARRGVTRTLWDLTNIPCPTASPELLVVGSDEYRHLTADFYLNH